MLIADPPGYHPSESIALGGTLRHSCAVTAGARNLVNAHTLGAPVRRINSVAPTKGPPRGSLRAPGWHFRKDATGMTFADGHSAIHKWLSPLTYKDAGHESVHDTDFVNDMVWLSSVSSVPLN